MKYTESEDRLDRATVNVKVRLTRDQMAELRRRAKAGDETLHDWLASVLTRAVEEELQDGDGNYTQRYGKGGD